MNKTPVSRREFLARGAAVGAAPLLTTATALVGPRLRAAGANPSEQVRIGLIGYGTMGVGDLDTFFLNPEVECVTVCDVDQAHLARGVEHVVRKRNRKPDAVNDFRRVLDRKDVDAVVICTPDHWHALMTVLACQAGKDIYVEKPLATTIAEGRAMLIAAQRHHRVVQMGSQWRSGIHWRDAVEFVRSGKLGKVSIVRAWVYLDWISDIGNPPDRPAPAGVDYDGWLGPAPKRPFNPNRFHFNFRWFWDYAGGLMTDWGVHLLNIILWAMGYLPPRTISSSGGILATRDNRETPDTQVTVYDFPGYLCVWEHKVGFGVGMNGRPWGISFAGPEGTLVVDDSGWEIIREPRKDTLESKRFRGTGDSRPAHVRNFLDCVKSRRPPVENLDIAHFVTKVAQLGNVAFRSGRTIVWDDKNERVIGAPEAERFLSVGYRKPWRLPYYARA
jgi:predicted dehydrogenase